MNQSIWFPENTSLLKGSSLMSIFITENERPYLRAVFAIHKLSVTTSNPGMQYLIIILFLVIQEIQCHSLRRKYLLH